MHDDRATFAPGSITHWHTHPLGQILYAISGVGQVQRAGGDVHEIRPATSCVCRARRATSGVEKIEHSLDGGAWTTYTAAVAVTGAGDHELRYRRGRQGRSNVEETKAATITIEDVEPTIVITGIEDGGTYGDGADLTIAWEVAGAGVKTVTGTLDGQPLIVGLDPAASTSSPWASTSSW